MILAVDGFKKKEVRLSYGSRYQNTFIIGQKGTGKSEHILLNMFFQDLEDKNHSLFVFTSKGDIAYKLYSMAKHAGRKVHIIKPEANTFHINLLAGEEQEVIENMEELLKSTHTMNEPAFFEELNRQLLRNAIKVVKRTLGEKATMEALYELIANPDGEGRKQFIHFSQLQEEDERIAKENKQLTSWFLQDYFNEKGKTFEYSGGLRLKIKKIIDYQSLYGFNTTEEDLPDLPKVLKNKEIVIVDTEAMKYREYGNLIGSYLLLKLKRLFLQTETVNSFVYLDDFHKYYPVWTEVFEESQLKEIGITLFLQETAQLNVYPSYKQVISNNVSNIILLERISHEDYLWYKIQMNGELLNRKRGEIVYKIINRDGSAESTSGVFYLQDDKIFNWYEKFLDYKKQLMKKKKKKTTPNIVEKKEENIEKEIVEFIIENELSDKMVIEHPSLPSEGIPEPKKTLKVVKTFEQFKREGDGKEYLSPAEVFEEDNE